MKVVLIGLGRTGSFIARQLRAPGVADVHIHDKDPKRIDMVADAMDPLVSVSVYEASAGFQPDVAILAGPAGTHFRTAEAMVAAGSSVVSICDDPDEVADLLRLDAAARDRGVTVAVGAGFVPGLSCLLARWAGDQLDEVDAINVAKAGTAGPACARQHHKALKNPGRDWVGHDWEVRHGGSGRDLAWFPEPFGARDCYRGALPSPLLLQRFYPQASRISARMAATRRDRFTSWLPMLRPPHEDGGPGGLRVEVRGMRDGAVETIVTGVMDYPSVAAASVATVTARAIVIGEAPVGADGLVTWNNPGRRLAELRQMGISVATFAGST